MIVVLGDVLLDVDMDGTVDRLCPDAPVPVLDVTGRTDRPGGAGLAALLAAADSPVRIVTALAPDTDGARLRDLLGAHAEVLAGPATGGTCVKTRFRVGGRPLLRADRGGGRPAPGFDTRCDTGAALAGARAVLVSDYGRGVAAGRGVREAVAAAVARGVPVVWDPHPRGPAPVPGVTVVTPNLREAQQVLGAGSGRAAETATALARHWHARHVAVTLGARGAVVAGADGDWAGAPLESPSDGDPCGAGDAFAARVTTALAAGRSVVEAVRDAVERAAAFVAAGGAGAVGTAGGPGAPGCAEPLCAHIRTAER